MDTCCGVGLMIIFHLDIFEKPNFFAEGLTANDVRQGQNSDFWLMASVCTLSNSRNLMEKLCVARDEKVGVYGFVFCRGMFMS